MQHWKCGRFSLPLGRKTLVMGIINATPDSFSSDGVLGAAAIERALQMVSDGADILDIGGESTRPGAAIISVDEEWQRVFPILEALSSRVEIPLSLDTSKAEIARRALDSGASIINDISGATADASMPEVLLKANCGIVIMHRRGTSQTMHYSAKVEIENVSCGGVIEEIKTFWRARIAAFCEMGIAKEHVCLDAGFGFGKSLEENLEVLRRGRDLKNFEYRNFRFPILSATSRKSTIGKILNNRGVGDVPPEERIFGTAATTAIAIQNGADIIRVHDVKEMAQVARMADSVVRS